MFDGVTLVVFLIVMYNFISPFKFHTCVYFVFIHFLWGNNLLVNILNLYKIMVLYKSTTLINNNLNNNNGLIL